MQYVFLVALVLMAGFVGGVDTGPDNIASKASNEASAITASDDHFQTRYQSDNADRTVNGTEVVVNDVPQNSFVDLRQPQINILSPQNIESTSVSVRAKVNMRSHEEGVIFIVYGYNEIRVDGLAEGYTKYDDIQSLSDDRARTKLVDRRPTGSDLYTIKLSRLVEGVKYYYKVCAEYGITQKDIVCGQTKTFGTNPINVRSNNFSAPRISSDRATNISAYSAQLSGDLDMNDGENGIAFVVYGQSEKQVKEITDIYNKYSQVDENGDYLQRTRLGVGLLGKSEYEKTIDDLERGETYYYSFCVEYEGEGDGLVCSSGKSFTTDSSNRDDLPDVVNKTPEVSFSRVTISGSVNMRDFIDGLVFFVYGTDFGDVEDAPEKSSFDRIRQSGDSLQKIIVDEDLDGKDSYDIYLYDLMSESRYNYRICVEYEDEDDRMRDKLFIKCSMTSSFVTY